MAKHEHLPTTQLDEQYPVGQQVYGLRDVSEMFIYHTSLSDIWQQAPNFGLFLELIWEAKSKSFVIASSYDREDCSVSDLLNVFTVRRSDTNEQVQIEDYDMDKVLEALLSGADNSELLATMTKSISDNLTDSKVSMKLPVHRLAVIPFGWTQDTFVTDQLSSITGLALDIISFDFANEKVISLKHGVTYDFPSHSCEQFDVEAEALTPTEASQVWIADNNNNMKGK